jgi:regulatory protein
LAFGAPSLKGRALRYLAQREHSRAELVRKLARHVEDKPEDSAAEQIGRALDDLTAVGLLSEERAAQSVLNGAGQRFGTRRLKQTLQAKGLPAHLVATTVQQSRATELERAKAVWQRRFGTPPVEPAEKARQMRFLAGRGFEGDIIRRVVAGLADDEMAHFDAPPEAGTDHDDTQSQQD